MKPEILPKQHEIEYVKSHYGKERASDIANALDISINRVYNICRYLELKHINLQVLFTFDQDQLILAGILGDGSIKKNGKNSYYRETHAIKEAEYVKWKYEILKDMCSQKGLYITDKRDDQIGFHTITSKSFNYYKNLDKKDVISQLTELGLLVYLLDDGWRTASSYRLCTGV